MKELEINKNDITYFQKKILTAGEKLYTPYAWRKTNNKFHALTAEILLQRTNADQVLNVYKDFIKKYKTANQFIKFPENIFISLGLNWRYNIYQKLCYKITEIKRIPYDKEELLKLPGVGEYVASAFLSLHMNKREFIIDSNIVRIYGRYFGFETDGETRRKKWFIDLSNRLTPIKKFKEYNYGLLDFTRLICNRNPYCDNCYLKRKCFYYSKNYTGRMV